jgi:ABC-2 type transport system ATP-binding protein
MRPIRLLACVLSLALAACGGSGGNDDATLGGGTSGDSSAPRVPVTETRAGTVYRQALASRVDGEPVVFQVFEPAQLQAGGVYPLVLHGNGYGDPRETVLGGFIERLVNAGYYVISIDHRGLGEGGGVIRLQSPDFEGQDLVQILDWAEDLPGLKRRANGQMVVGSFGDSYGGLYQFLLAGTDPQHRLRVLAPDITPHDIVEVVNQNNVLKSTYALAVAAQGEIAQVQNGQLFTRPGPGQDATVYETIVMAALTNQLGEPGRNFLRYHSPRYFCDGEPAGPQDFIIGTPDPRSVPPTPYEPMDVLLTQGVRDTFFNVNEALDNYRCLKAAGGDVRLLTHETGHILPVSITNVPGNLEEALDPFFDAITIPNFQDADRIGRRFCGAINIDDVQFAWFEEKLSGKQGALAAVLPIGNQICLSLAVDDAITVPEVPQGGQEFPLDGSTPQLNSVLGVAGSVLGNGAREALLATQPLYTAPVGGAVIAGIPTMDIELSGLSGQEPADCPTPLSLAGCDPILFLGIGHRKAGTTRWDLIDDQLTPIRGFGAHSGDMSAIGERLAESDELALLIYGFHTQYSVTWSRDLLVPATNFRGSIRLPLRDGA